MRIKHLLLVLLFILIHLGFASMYKFSFENNTINPNILDDYYTSFSVFLFILYHLLFIISLIIFIAYLSVETNVFCKIGKFLNKKIL